MNKLNWALVWVVTACGVGSAGAMVAQQAAATTAATVPPPTCNPQETAFLKSRLEDFAGLNRYAKDNAALAPPVSGEKRVVFLGDSITDMWGRLPDTGPFFPGKPYINRGIGGETTEQLLGRFEQDVVHLHPAVVVILGGTNDIAGNTGPTTPQSIEDNYTAMSALARASGIRVVLASITPADHYNWKPGVRPSAEIRELNAWLKTFCASGQCTFLDYWSAMSDPNGAMLPGYSRDGVHPTAKGFAVMAPLAERAIATALATPPPSGAATAQGQ